MLMLYIRINILWIIIVMSVANKSFYINAGHGCVIHLFQFFSQVTNKVITLSKIANSIYSSPTKPHVSDVLTLTHIVFNPSN